MLHRRGIARILVAGLVTTGLVVALPSSAGAAGPGEWSQLSANPAGNGFPRGSNIDEPTIARFGGRLQVVWPVQTSAAEDAYYTAEVDASGATTTPSTLLLGGWGGLVENPRLFPYGGERLLVFSGLRDGATDPYSKGTAFYALGSSATTWGLGGGSLSATEQAYAASGFDALDDAGTPVWVGNPGSTNGLTWHAGVSPTIPAPLGSDSRFLLSSCCAYDAAAARDSSSGAVHAAFFSNSDVESEKGIWVGQIRPSAGGWTRAPGSFVPYGGSVATTAPDQRIAMTGRPGGGVYLAYGTGYPTTSGVLLWRVGSAAPMSVPSSAGARDVSVAAAPDGSLWVAWVTDDLESVRVVHTDAAVTRFGAVRTIAAPASYGEVWKTAVDATGPVDLVVSAKNTPGAFNVFHQQVTEALLVTAKPAKVGAGGSVTVTVSLAAGPVKGATVKAFGASYTTNKKGKATVAVPSGTGKGKKTVKATKKPYGAGKTTVKVG